jgi:hypothetical protein
MALRVLFDQGYGIVELLHVILTHAISSLCSSVIQVHRYSSCSNRECVDSSVSEGITVADQGSSGETYIT